MKNKTYELVTVTKDIPINLIENEKTVPTLANKTVADWMRCEASMYHAKTGRHFHYLINTEIEKCPRTLNDTHALTFSTITTAEKKDLINRATQEGEELENE